tara:strand:- start:163 stop:1029 length:867 start_codon:yes stop_codon:yes gene_type:complete
VHKILLTGSSGFIGSNILNSFSKDYKFYILVRKKPIKRYLKNKNIKIIKFKKYNSLNSKLKKIKIDTVIHCATHYVKDHKFQDIEKLCYSNLIFGNIILENLKNLKASKFINFSTVWEDGNAKKDNIENLYSAYKKNFSTILSFYKKNLKKVNFYELMVSDTFGNNDQRKKIIHTLKMNYHKNKSTAIISKNLYMNLLNVSDIVNAIKLILKKNVIPKKYSITNTFYIKILDLIKIFNTRSQKRLKVKWLSNRKIKYKIYPYDKLNGWKPRNSYIKDIINYIKVKKNL